jgi:hypothetical protein
MEEMRKLKSMFSSEVPDDFALKSAVHAAGGLLEAYGDAETTLLHWGAKEGTHVILTTMWKHWPTANFFVQDADQRTPFSNLLTTKAGCEFLAQHIDPICSQVANDTERAVLKTVVQCEYTTLDKAGWMQLCAEVSNTKSKLLAACLASFALAYNGPTIVNRLRVSAKNKDGFSLVECYAGVWPLRDMPDAVVNSIYVEMWGILRDSIAKRGPNAHQMLAATQGCALAMLRDGRATAAQSPLRILMENYQPSFTSPLVQVILRCAQCKDSASFATLLKSGVLTRATPDKRFTLRAQQQMLHALVQSNLHHAAMEWISASPTILADIAFLEVIEKELSSKGARVAEMYLQNAQGTSLNREDLIVSGLKQGTEAGDKLASRMLEAAWEVDPSATDQPQAEPSHAQELLIASHDVFEILFHVTEPGAQLIDEFDLIDMTLTYEFSSIQARAPPRTQHHTYLTYEAKRAHWTLPLGFLWFIRKHTPRIFTPGEGKTSASTQHSIQLLRNSMYAAMRCNECGLVSYLMRMMQVAPAIVCQTAITFPGRFPNTATALAICYLEASTSTLRKTPYLSRAGILAQPGEYYTIIQLALDYGFPHIVLELLSAGILYNPTSDPDYRRSVTNAILWHISSPAHTPGPVTELYRAIFLLVNGTQLSSANGVVSGRESKVVAALLSSIPRPHTASSLNPFNCLA